MESSKGIKLPIAKNIDRLPVGPKHLLPIIIHKDETIRTDFGKEITLRELPDYIRTNRINDPQLVVLFVIDKECKMRIVNKVLEVSRNNYGIQVRFMTSLFNKYIN